MNAPLGLFETHMDDKGRIRLPLALQTSIQPNATLVVTGADGDAVHVYPLANWPEDQAPPATATMDNNGRMLLPAPLRDRFPSSRAVLEWRKNHIRILSVERYEELRATKPR